MKAVPALTRTRLKSLIEDGQVLMSTRELPLTDLNAVESPLDGEGEEALPLETDYDFDGSLANTDFNPLKQPSKKLKKGVCIGIYVPEIIDATPLPQDIEFGVVYEDDHLIVVNKPAGLVVHPGAGNPDGTLVNGLLHHCGDSLSGIGGVARPGIVHRLDKGTSGLMVVAKRDSAHQFLSSQFIDRSQENPDEKTLKRTYFALTWGVANPPEGKVSGNIGRDPRHRQRMKILKFSGKEAITHYFTHEKVGLYASLIECTLETGRTHQIRVHMTSLGAGLVGDPLYGRKPRGLDTETKAKVHDLTGGEKRPMLHAGRLSFIHPESKEVMEFEADLPQDFADLYAYFKEET